MKNIYAAFFGGVALIVLGLFFILERSKGVEVSTDKNSYGAGNALTVSIKNNLGGEICFSSCYPYYLEKKRSDWVDYDYDECLKRDEVAKCIRQGDVKTFKIVLTQSETGEHRLKIPVCVECQIGQDFKADKVYYSNSFQIQ